jgi:hypothetical protein
MHCLALGQFCVNFLKTFVKRKTWYRVNQDLGKRWSYLCFCNPVAIATKIAWLLQFQLRRNKIYFSGNELLRIK